MLNRYAGRGSMDDICRETLALTKMDWNNDSPVSDRAPVTLSFRWNIRRPVEANAKADAATLSGTIVHVTWWYGHASA